MSMNYKKLDLLQIHHSGCMLLTTESESIDYDVISLDDNKVTYYTGKGIQEMNESPERASEFKKFSMEELISKGYVEITPISQIERIIF